MNKIPTYQELFSTLVYAPQFTTQTHPDGFTQDLEQQIQIFHNRVRVWILNHAAMLINENDAGFAVLAILNSVPEMLAQFQGFKDRHGKTGNDDGVIKGDLYKQGLIYLFHEIQGEYQDHILRILWNNKRNAIAHMGLTSEGVILNGDLPNLTLCKINEELAIVVNPKEWCQRIETKIEEYVNKLLDKSNTELRDNFRARFINPY